MSVKAVVVDDSAGKLLTGFGNPVIIPEFKKGEIVHIQFMSEDFVIVQEYPTLDYLGRPSWWNKERFREISDLTFDDLIEETNIQIGERLELEALNMYKN